MDEKQQIDATLLPDIPSVLDGVSDIQNFADQGAASAGIEIFLKVGVVKDLLCALAGFFAMQRDLDTSLKSLEKIRPAHESALR